MAEWILSTPTTVNYVTGYFYKSSLDQTSRGFAGLETNFVVRMPYKNDHAQVGFFDIILPKPEFVTCASTFELNCQVCAILLWLSRDTLIFSYHVGTLQLIKIFTFDPKIVDEICSTQKYDGTRLRCNSYQKLSKYGKLHAIDTFIDGVRGVFLYDI